MTAPMGCELIGRWRIVEADLWDRAHLDLVEPASINIQSDGRGEIAFGAMQAGLDLDYGRTTVFFTWAGFDEMDEVTGSGSAELQDDGSLGIEFAHHLGDEAVLKAIRMTSSTTCYWTEELAARVVWPGSDAPAVCIFDTGVNRGHALLEPALAAADLHTLNGDWGTDDHHPHSHGTSMAGMALHGDLTAALSDLSERPLAHRLESVKLLPPAGFDMTSSTTC